MTNSSLADGDATEDVRCLVSRRALAAGRRAPRDRLPCACLRLAGRGRGVGGGGCRFPGTFGAGGAARSPSPKTGPSARPAPPPPARRAPPTVQRVLA